MALRENLKGKFDEVIFPDHELLYYEASKVSSDVFVLMGKLVMRRGDSKLFEIARKYYRYGKSLKVKNLTNI